MPIFAQNWEIKKLVAKRPGFLLDSSNANPVSGSIVSGSIVIVRFKCYLPIYNHEC